MWIFMKLLLKKKMGRACLVNHLSLNSPNTHIPLCWRSSTDFGKDQFSRHVAAFPRRGFHIAPHSFAAATVPKQYEICRTVCPSWRYRDVLLSCPTPSIPVERLIVKYLYAKLWKYTYNVLKYNIWMRKWFKYCSLLKVMFFPISIIYPAVVEFYRVLLLEDRYIFSTLLLWLQRLPPDKNSYG